MSISQKQQHQHFTFLHIFLIKQQAIQASVKSWVKLYCDKYALFYEVSNISIQMTH